MSFPTGTVVSTSNLSSGSSNPSLARADLLAAVTALNSIIDSANDASGVVVLDGGGQVPSGLLPQSITLPSTAGNQVINPGTQVVNIRNFLRLQPTSTVDVKQFANSATGDIAYISNYNSAPAIAFYDGTKWMGMPLSAMNIIFLQQTTVALSAPVVLVATPV